MVNPVVGWYRPSVKRVHPFKATDVVPVFIWLNITGGGYRTPQWAQKVVFGGFGVELVQAQRIFPCTTLIPARGTDATIVPLRRHIEQSHLRGLTIPSGESSSSTTAPQWHDARCFCWISVPPTRLIIFFQSEMKCNWPQRRNAPTQSVRSNYQLNRCRHVNIYDQFKLSLRCVAAQYRKYRLMRL